MPAWAVLRHRGRKSGRQYAVPVAVIATETTFIIALPWGPETDWLRNVRAADGCTIRWKGADFECTQPVLVSKEVAIAAARGVTGRMLQLLNPGPKFVQLTRALA